ncbi:MFS transporter [Sporomusa sphaeroides]|uniref:Multidrug resistance protein 3 n=1 Tax=Sporomusa sphaeroides DSM 2875 TaxID=1337886 RepID=A0ABM9W3C0_9FIRM|nr:MFS transporter [Sporomusa sphaeroides]OLS55645.1 multidrug resistance protein 3 [Sporomusa sphaeroides DSM 2875]CVK19429.1 Multidrug resistance protein 3 [Sporomusa sphaeroides DSM 2875]
MNNRWFVFTGVLLGVTAHMTMQTLVATILPAISAQLGDSHLYSWVFTGYLLMSTITVPLFSKLADLYGYKLSFLLGLLLFLFASLLCGLASSLAFLVGARLVQGIGAGMIAPVTMALISMLFPLTKERAKAMSLFAAVQMLSNVLGPILGGVIAATLGWSVAFFMVAPLCVISFVIIYFCQFGPVPGRGETKPRVDYAGAFLLGGAIAAFTQTWSLFEQTGWTFTTTLLLATSVIMIILLVRQEKRHPDPILSQAMLRIPQVSLSSLSALLAGILNFGTIFILPLFSVATFANDPAKSSYFLLPFTVGVSIGAIASGFLLQKISYQSLAQISWCFAIAGFSGIGLAGALTLPVFWSFLFAVSIGCGIGSLMPTFLLPAQNAVKENQQATVSGLIQISRNIGGTIGIPLLTSLLVFTRSLQQEALQYGIVFFTLALLSCLGFAVGSKLKV